MRFSIKMFATAFIASFLSINNAFADNAAEMMGFMGTSTEYLRQIAANTYGTLVAVNNIPVYLSELTEMAMSWLAQDTDGDSIISTNQDRFAGLGYWSVQDMDVQNNMQQQLIADMMHRPVSDFTNPPDNPTILGLFPTVNDIAYSTVLGAPPAPKGSASAYNYIKNASGMTLYHVIPGITWVGTKDDRDRYSAYYSTIMSVSSYNGYLLSNLVAENQNGNQLSDLQNQLIGQVSNSGWILQIATEDLGKVLREILLFDSQSYVLLTQLLQTEKQMLAAHAMTNTLLLLYGQQNESQMVSKAQGSPPKV
ncbi:MAG: hypothetical protein EPO11_05750 [Gammaproteobacteria bacterium]|nr:MAG: hypothetical protein EPO11_05750 [Gammaproteobacteria bacterium]